MTFACVLKLFPQVPVSEMRLTSRRFHLYKGKHHSAQQKSPPYGGAAISAALRLQVVEVAGEETGLTDVGQVAEL